MSEKFIPQIAYFVQKYAPQYGIKVHSPIIAQAILESGNGSSELAANANNFFGLKYKAGRCPTACGVYHKIGSEQNPDGTYVSSAMQWCQFSDMEQCVIGYFDFVNNPRYSNLKGVTDPKVYLDNIKADGYATSLKYVDNLMRVIETYNLTQYDNKEVTNMAKKIIAIDAGHCLTTSGKRCMKSIDPNETREWYLNDRIADKLENLLANYNVRVVRVDDTTGKKDVNLTTRTTIANSANADVYVSIHHNAGINGGSGGGTVVYYYSTKTERLAQASSLYNNIVALTGLVGNRSSKVSKYAYYVLKNTKMPAFLIENGFMDSKTDVPIILKEAHADKTAKGILNWLVSEFNLEPIVSTPVTNTPVTSTSTTDKIYRVQCGTFKTKKNAEVLKNKLAAAGFTATIV